LARSKKGYNRYPPPQACSKTKFSGGAKQAFREGIAYKNNVFIIFLGWGTPWVSNLGITFDCELKVHSHYNTIHVKKP